MGLDPAGNAHIGTTRAAIEMLSDKLGWVLMTLGGMLLQPVCLLSHPQPQTREGSPAPSVAPDAVLPVAVPPAVSGR